MSRNRKNKKEASKHSKDKKAAAVASTKQSKKVSKKTTPASQAKVVLKSQSKGKQKAGNRQQRQQQQRPQNHGSKNHDKIKDKGASTLSKLQLEMRRRLDGSKFRMLNEELYSTTGDEAFQSFQDDPALFDVYHKGFREQAERWPMNPLDEFIAYVRKHPNAVVADFGCGDARLAESVKNKVFSFDLVSRKPCVTACNVAQVPLPDESIDIAVYCLALMGTCVDAFLKEAHRVLNSRGVLKIAEVKSRFETPEIGGLTGFVAMVTRLGFDLRSQHDKNKMFVLWEFAKSARRPEKVESFALKPCEYKRR